MGHALEFVRADIIARFKKAEGFDVFFNTGTDEHGMKIYEKATESGKTAQEFVDNSFLQFKKSVEVLGMDKDLHFVRTTSAGHEKAAQEFWNRVKKNGFIYKKTYQAKYCVGCEEIKSDSELLNNECPLHPGRKLELIEEENYFFKYSAFGDKLIKFYKKNPKFVVPDFRFNEIKSFVERGLHDFSISRLRLKMPWGIPVPGDRDQVMYVWFDALVSYISTLGWPEDEENFKKYWIKGNPTQYCGKDNLRFQSAMWQAMLMAARLDNSHQIIIYGVITADHGLKMSKTLGNVVDPKEIVRDYSTDALRFFLAKEISNFEDSPFTMDRFKDAYNAGLANGLGNLVSRIMKMAETHLEKAPAISQKSLPKEFTAFIDGFNIQNATNFIWEHITELDQYIQRERPFEVVKKDKKKAQKIIKHMVIKLYNIACMLGPIMPETSETIKKLIKENKMPEKSIFPRKD